MRLNESGLKNQEQWLQRGYRLPAFDREKVRSATRENPFWIHFGAGNIFKAYQANVVQNLLNSDKLDRGLVVAEGFDYEIIEKMNRPHDDYSILVTLKADGTVEKTVVGSVVESLTVNPENKADDERLKEIFRNESLQIASFTITEKGYRLVNGKGVLLEAVESDFKKGPQNPCSYIGKVAALLYERFLAGEKPIAMVSMDNCSHNGTRLFEAVRAYASKWAENGLAEPAFETYVSTPEKVSFPWTMIDKITPRPDESVEEMLHEDGIEGLEPVITTKNTYVAPFVNAEECEYLVIEDAFPNGRPALEQGGLIFTDRQTVNQVEKMKVCTCLNPLHTALAVFGCLLGYDLISKEMKDEVLAGLVERIGYNEGLPVVADPGIIHPKEFLDTVLKVRIPNPFMPDTPQRIATDTSQKLAIRFGETIKAYRNSPDRKVADLKCIPLVFAGWLRYLTGIDDTGKEFSPSADPLLETLKPYAAVLRQLYEKSGRESSASRAEQISSELRPLISDEKIFGVNLYEAGMAQTVCNYLAEMLEGPGAVRKTLERYVQ